MTKETKKSESPACACGKGDLYEDWIKLQENKKEEVSDSTTLDPAGDDKSLDDEAGKENQKQAETRK
jgi:hypothetical protein